MRVSILAVLVSLARIELIGSLLFSTVGPPIWLSTDSHEMAQDVSRHGSYPSSNSFLQAHGITGEILDDGAGHMSQSIRSFLPLSSDCQGYPVILGKYLQFTGVQSGWPSGSLPSVRLVTAKPYLLCPDVSSYCVSVGDTVRFSADVISGGGCSVDFMMEGVGLASESISSVVGVKKIEFDYRFEKVGLYSGSIKLMCRAKKLVEYPLTVRVTRKRRLLILSPRTDASGILKRVFDADGFDVTVGDLKAVKEFMNKELGPDVVVIHGFGAFQLEKIYGDLRKLVAEQGCGLLVYGAPDFFDFFPSLGPGLKRLLPVMPVVQKPSGKIRSLLGVIIDSSGSMGDSFKGRSKLSFSIDVVGETLRKLDALRDEVFVIAFAGKSVFLIPPTPAGERQRFDTRLKHILPYGTTHLSKAIQKAAGVFSGYSIGNKHLLLISDGHWGADRAESESLVNELSASNVSVSVLGIGQHPDTSGLEDFASAVGARVFYPAESQSFPSFYLQSIQTFPYSSWVENSIVPRNGSESGLLEPLPVHGCPPLLGFNVCQARPGTNVLLTDSTGLRPLLVQSRWGAGRVAFFSSVAVGKASRLWVSKWAGFSQFHATLARQVVNDHASPLLAVPLVAEDQVSGVFYVQPVTGGQSTHNLAYFFERANQVQQGRAVRWGPQGMLAKFDRPVHGDLTGFIVVRNQFGSITASFASTSGRPEESRSSLTVITNQQGKMDYYSLEARRRGMVRKPSRLMTVSKFRGFALVLACILVLLSGFGGYFRTVPLWPE